VKFRASAAAWFTLVSALSAGASADEFDASLGITLGAGAPRALAAASGLDARGSGLSRVELPSRPSPSYRLKLAAPIPFAPAADDKGSLVVTHGGGKLTELDARGRLTWSLRVGPDGAATGPVVGNDGLRWLVTLGGEVAAVSPEGRLRFRKALSGFGSLEGALAVPLSTGGLALASGNRVSILDRDGDTLWISRTDEVARALLEHRAELLAVMADGKVLRRGAEGQFTPLGDLGGRVDAAALVPGAAELVAVVGQRELVVLELGSGKRRVLLSEPTLTLTGALAIGTDGSIRALALGGLLIGMSKQGQEAFRAPLSNGALGFGTSSPPPLIDSRGTTAVNLADTGLALVSPAGEIELVAGSACPEPLRPTPIGTRALVLSCRSGLVFALSDRGP
jgi:hypothetical protein